jgi:hypothetical protein
VTNPDLRRRLTQQRAEAEKTFSAIKSEVELTRLAFDPYMSGLKDIGAYLRGNTSPAAIATVTDMVTKANTDYAETIKHIDAVVEEMNKIMAASGEAAASPAPAVPGAAPAAPAK